MKFLLSNFYAVRFMKPYMLPFSTAVFDPKWFHDNKGNSYNYLDKNGVLNGLRVSYFRPQSDKCRGQEGCGYVLDYLNTDEYCPFLMDYWNQINSLDFSVVKKYFNTVVPQIQNKMHFTEEPIVVLLVHESVDNRCSEREVLLKVLNNHGINISEFDWRSFKNRYGED